MAAEARSAELAALLDLAERPRPSGWSLRAALVRYGQPQPQRASDLIELVRRIESALHPLAKVLEREGAAIWATVSGPSAPEAVDADERLVVLLRSLVAIDDAAEALSRWAVRASADGRPDAAVDAVVEAVTAQLEALGIEREERPRPRGSGRRG